MMRKIGLILKNTLFAMTQEEFNKLLFDIKLKNPDLIVPNAIWSISESKEPDSIHVNVALICKIADGNKENLSLKSLTKNNEASVVSAILKLNEELLSDLNKKLDKIDN